MVSHGCQSEHLGMQVVSGLSRPGAGYEGATGRCIPKLYLQYKYRAGQRFMACWVD